MSNISTFVVYQINISARCSKYVNLNGREAAIEKFPEYEAYMSVMMKGSSGFSEEYSEYYTPVARIDARSMDEAFRIGNFVCEEDRTLIQVFGTMSSISVGDILHNVETDETFMVDSVGFSPVKFVEMV